MVLIYGSSLEALTSGISKYNALKIVHDDEPSCESASTIVGILGLMPDIRSLTITSAPSQSSQALVIGPSFVQSHSSHLLFTSSPWDLYLPLLRMETLRLGTTVQSDALLLRSHHLRHLTIGEALSQPRVEALLKAIRLHDMKTLDIRLQAPLSEALLLHSVARYTSGLKRLSIRSPPYEIRSNGELDGFRFALSQIRRLVYLRSDRRYQPGNEDRFSITASPSNQDILSALESNGG